MLLNPLGRTAGRHFTVFSVSRCDVMKSTKEEQREIKDMIDSILYRLGPWPQFNVKDQILSFNVRADDRRQESI